MESLLMLSFVHVSFTTECSELSSATEPQSQAARWVRGLVCLWHCLMPGKGTPCAGMISQSTAMQPFRPSHEDSAALITATRG